MDETPRAAPGWYPDGSGGQRYWDGTQWTNQMASFPASSANPTPTKKKMPVWAWVLLAVALLPLSFCLFGFFGLAGLVSVGEKAEQKEEREAAQIEAPAKADVVVTPEQINKEFVDNELKADTKYKGKWVEVRGVVSKIDTELDPEKYLLEVSSEADDFSFESVTCHGMSKQVLSTIDKGQDITVIGLFDDGGDFGVDMKSCHLR